MLCCLADRYSVLAQQAAPGQLTQQMDAMEAGIIKVEPVLGGPSGCPPARCAQARRPEDPVKVGSSMPPFAEHGMSAPHLPCLLWCKRSESPFRIRVTLHV